MFVPPTPHGRKARRPYTRTDRDELLRRVDLRALASAFTTLNPGGHGRCPHPNHDDRNPSFGVFRGRDGIERFKCHGCGWSGTAIDFVVAMRSITMGEAFRYLEERWA